MMALALQKKKREDRRNIADMPSPPTNLPVPDTVVVKQESPPAPLDLGGAERGRRIDKGKTTKISVIGFDADGVDDYECVCTPMALFLVGTDPNFRQGY
jgi:hypothetical protein